MLRRWGAVLAIGAVLMVTAGCGAAGGQSGATAKPRPVSQLKTQDFHSLAFDPQNPQTMYFGHHNGVLRSDDGGVSWQAVGGAGSDAMALAIPVSGGSTFYMAGHDVFKKTTDGGKTWVNVPHDLPGTDIHGFAMSPTNPNQLFAAVVGHGVFRSDDGGAHWTLTTKDVPGIMGLAMAKDGTLYAGAMQQGAIKSGDGGKTWTRMATPPPGTGVGPIAVDPAGVIYAGTADGVYRSTDGGASWQATGLTGKDIGIFVVAVNPQDPKVLMAIDAKGNAYRSTDGGATWPGK